MEQATDPSEAKRQRILAISRNLHSIPVEEGGMLKRQMTPAPPPAPPPQERSWSTALAAGGIAALAAGLWMRRRRG